MMLFGKHYTFVFRVNFSLLCAGFFILFCLLGNWQRCRYHYKKTLLETYHARLSSAAEPFLSVAAKNQDLLQFQPVIVEGHYVPELTVLMQNQFYHSQLGYDVLTPFYVNNTQQFLLVDRGWITEVQKETGLFLLEKPNGQHIKGYLKLVNDYQFILGNNSMDEKARPLIIQKIDLADITRITHHAYYPFILRLNPKESYGFIRDWNIVITPAERHLGYAVQWFSMAIVLLIAYVCFCFEYQPTHKE